MLCCYLQCSLISRQCYMFPTRFLPECLFANGVPNLKPFVSSFWLHRLRPQDFLGMTSAHLASSAPGERVPQCHAGLGFTPQPLAWLARTSASHAPQGTTATALGCPTPWRQGSAMQGEGNLQWPENGGGAHRSGLPGPSSHRLILNS